MKQHPNKARTPKRARPSREGIEQALPDEHSGLHGEQRLEEATIAQPQPRGTAETGEDEDLPEMNSVERGGAERRRAEP